ncbi:MAG TPA: heterodisulfide reductase-related iron-sulfur binding cluster [Rectinemataceae bacterium]|nr:heterodisulfide reductase-related iron-sulfur binding cluster [Rectinemataceae bacterium]
MGDTREIYWNVGHGSAPIMYVLAFSAMALMVWGFLPFFKRWRLGKPLARTDHPLRRLLRAIGIDFGQWLVGRSGPGKLHAAWFWGFGILFIGTLIVMAQSDFTDPVFKFIILKGRFYDWFSLILDVAGAVAIFALLSLAVRRFVARPKNLETRVEDWLVHLLFALIIVTGFVIEGLRMSVTEIVQNPALAAWSPVGRLVGGLFVGMDGGAAKALHAFLWWFHFALVLAFIVALPRSKLRHIFTTAAAAFFAPLEPKGTIATIDLEDEKITDYGFAKVSDLSWKDIFDADACTKCARCQDLCPAWNSSKPLSPMKLIADIGLAVAKGAEGVLRDSISTDELWACTTCRACQDTCPAGVEHVNKVIDMRRNLALMEGEFPDEGSRKAAENLEVNGNPFGMAFASRGDWAKDLQVVDATSSQDFDVLYFAGCYASFDARNKKVARAFVESCNAAGVKVGILGAAEKCCGEPVRKLGNEYLYQALATENIETMKATGAKSIVTTCPHCFNTIGRDYKDLGLDLPVEHHSTYLARLLDEGRLPVEKKDFDCSYHDSCYIGRYKDIYEEPRHAIEALGGNVKEMEAHHEKSFCCGGGGGRILAEEKLGTRIAVKRADMAAKTEASTLVANCPFCLTMLEDGVKTGGHEGKIETIDLAELVASRIKKA